MHHLSLHTAQENSLTVVYVMPAPPMPITIMASEDPSVNINSV